MHWPLWAECWRCSDVVGLDDLLGPRGTRGALSAGVCPRTGQVVAYEYPIPLAGVDAVTWAKACRVGMRELVCPGVVLSVGVLEVQCVACTVLDQGYFHQHAGCGDGFGLVVAL